MQLLTDLNQKHHSSPRPGGKGERPGAFRHSVVYFLIALIVMLVVSAFLQIRGGSVIVAVVFSAVLILAVLAVGARKRTLIGAGILAVPSLIERWYAIHGHHPAADLLSMIGGLLLLSLVVFKLMRFILHAPRVRSEVICAGIAVYLLIGMFFAFIYMIAADARPGSFAVNGVVLTAGNALENYDALYFSFITIATVGYGDIVPATRAMKMVAAGEAILGAFYMTILMARLVSLYSSRPREREND